MNIHTNCIFIFFLPVISIIFGDSITEERRIKVRGKVYKCKYEIMYRKIETLEISPSSTVSCTPNSRGRRITTQKFQILNYEVSMKHSIQPGKDKFVARPAIKEVSPMGSSSTVEPTISPGSGYLKPAHMDCKCRLPLLQENATAPTTRIGQNMARFMLQENGDGSTKAIPLGEKKRVWDDNTNQDELRETRDGGTAARLCGGVALDADLVAQITNIMPLLLLSVVASWAGTGLLTGRKRREALEEEETEEERKRILGGLGGINLGGGGGKGGLLGILGLLAGKPAGNGPNLFGLLGGKNPGNNEETLLQILGGKYPTHGGQAENSDVNGIVEKLVEKLDKETINKLLKNVDLSKMEMNMDCQCGQG